MIQQYETMRREASKLANPHPHPHPHQASKLAKKHQKEVATLDDKFKERMHGLAGRFQKLDEEQAKHEQVLREVEALQQTVSKLEALADEGQAPYA